MIEFRNIYFLLLLFVFGAPFQKSFSQSEEKTIYQKVRVHLDGKGLRPLAALGVEVEQVKAAGFKVDIILPDAIAHYLEESKKVQPVSLEQLETRDQTCYGAVQKYRVPFNFKYGSMGSYLTLQEIALYNQQHQSCKHSSPEMSFWYIHSFLNFSHALRASVTAISRCSSVGSSVPHMIPNLSVTL